MSEFVKTAFAPLAAPKGGTCVVFVGPSLKCGPSVHGFLGQAADLIASAAKTRRPVKNATPSHAPVVQAKPPAEPRMLEPR